MYTGFSKEQKMIQESAHGFLLKNCPGDFVRKMAGDEKGYTVEFWNSISELGWPAMIVPEKYEGFGLGFMELAVLLEEMGGFCLPGPFFTSVLLGEMCLLEAGSEKQKAELLPSMARGEIIATLALNESTSEYHPASISTSATANSEGYHVDGEKRFVADAHVADYLLTVVRTGPPTTTDSERGLSVLVVDSKSPGIKFRQLKTIAGDKQFEIVFDGVAVPKQNLLGEMNGAWPWIKRVLQKAATGKCAEMTGGARRVLDMTVSYTKQRKQFGKLIGSFQAIQHHCANMLTDLETSRWLMYKTAWMIDQNRCHDLQVSICKAWCNQALRRVIALSHQVFGGIGYAEEHDLPLYFRRARTFEALFGNLEYHRKEIAESLITDEDALDSLSALNM